MYEMHGVSQLRRSHNPIARIAMPVERAATGVESLGSRLPDLRCKEVASLAGSPPLAA
jgi:hypothetical protein